MSEESNKHSSVGKSFEVDQRAIKIFLNSLPDNWLPRKQDPDFFLDYMVELVENGEPTGLHFAAQVKGFQSAKNCQQPLSYSFKTKHLAYYLSCCQHPVFLFLINVTEHEGYWCFAQKHLKENISIKALEEQETFTICFPSEDNLINYTKFKCLLPESEKFVRNLHPGSIQAALQKRKIELESKDPRCSISISLIDGKEHVSITPKEAFSFTTKIQSVNIEDWRNFWERGAKLRLNQGEIEIVGAPILSEAVATCGDLEIQYGNEIPGSLHVISGVEIGKVVPVQGHFRGGTKYVAFQGQLPNSPLQISFETTFLAAQKGEIFDLSIGFSPSKWTGQQILSLAYLDQIISFAKAFSSEANPEMEIFINGIFMVRGEMGGRDSVLMRRMANTVEWFGKCRWLARYFKVNPIMPDLSNLELEEMSTLEHVYELLTKKQVAISSPNIKLPFYIGEILSDDEIKESDRILRIEKPEQTINFFGVPILLGPTRHIFTDVGFVS